MSLMLVELDANWLLNLTRFSFPWAFGHALYSLTVSQSWLVLETSSQASYQDCQVTFQECYWPYCLNGHHMCPTSKEIRLSSSIYVTCFWTVEVACDGVLCIICDTIGNTWKGSNQTQYVLNLIVKDQTKISIGVLKLWLEWRCLLLEWRIRTMQDSNHA